METENENKVIEEKIEDIDVSEKSKTEDVSKVETEKSLIQKIKDFRNNVACPAVKKNKKTIIIVLILLVLAVFISVYMKYQKKNDVGPVVAKEAVKKFVEENIPEGTKVDIEDAVKESGLYKIKITVEKQEIESYISLDGKKFFPQVIDLSEKDKNNAEKEQAVAEKTEAENKTDIPVVDLFVMSYCPYGLQMERGFLPAVEALGNKIKFNLKFVDYTLHGQKEVDENLIQYCVQKSQPTKLNTYLKCFWKDSKGASSSCMKVSGINPALVNSCVAETKKQFNPTEKSLGINKEDAQKFGVQGSPTLVVNGTTISSGRDASSVLKAICSGFSTEPKECQAKLSATAPTAGFDDQAAATGGASADASCATPSK